MSYPAALTFTDGSSYTDAESQTQLLYVAYFGRCGDPSGVSYWENNLNTGSQTIDEMAVSFGQSAEAESTYPFLSDPTDSNTTDIQNFITDIYYNLFNRAPDSAGLTYWTNQLEADQSSYNASTITLLQLQTDVADFIMDVIRGALNIANGGVANDITTMKDKTSVAKYFTEQIVAKGKSYVPGSGAKSEPSGETTDTFSHSIILICDDPDSVSSCNLQSDTFIAGL